MKNLEWKMYWGTFENFISVVGNSNDENNFPQKLLLTNT